MEHFGRAHYSLTELQALVRAPESRVITRSAHQGAVEAGMAGEEEIVECVCGLLVREIYKTMTTHFDNTLWQDVYRTRRNGVDLYVKLQKSPGGQGVVISFKLA